MNVYGAKIALADVIIDAFGWHENDRDSDKIVDAVEALIRAVIIDAYQNPRRIDQ